MHGILFIQDLAVILVVAGAVGWACQRVGLSVIVGFFAAGIRILNPGSQEVLRRQDGLLALGTSAQKSGFRAWLAERPAGESGPEAPLV